MKLLSIGQPIIYNDLSCLMACSLMFFFDVSELLKIEMLSLRTALFRPMCSFSRHGSTLVLAEHDNATLNPATLNAITAAKAVGGDITCLVAGTSCDAVAKEVASLDGVSKVLVAENAAYAVFLPEKLTPVPFVLSGPVQFLLESNKAKLDISNIIFNFLIVKCV